MSVNLEEAHSLFMHKALQLGEKGRFTAPPNPWVGCVIVQQGTIVGQGYTQPFGYAHAERVALEEAGEKAKGATVYVTLEPCPHVGKTGACTEALIRSGVRSVVIAILDPDRHVSGKGVQRLREAGIIVQVGVLEKEVRESLISYLHHRRTGMPFCLLKAAISIDGKIAAKDGSSRWISGPEARKDSHLLRAQSQAILVGSGTILADSPQLTVRNLEGNYPQPLRVILDRRGRTHNQIVGPALLFTSNAQKCEGIEVIVKEKFTLHEVMTELGRRGILQLLVEGGTGIYSSFIKEGFCHRLVLYMGNIILGKEGIDLFSNLSIPSINNAQHMTLISTLRFGDTLRVDYANQIESE